MFVRNRIDKRMVDAMKLTAVFSITRSMIGTANYKRAAPFFFPSLNQTPQFTVHLPKRRRMAFYAVTRGSLPIKIIGIMNRVYIQIEKNLFFLVFFFYFP